MQLEGTLRTVTFRNSENGWSVLKFEIASTKEPLPVTGYFPELQPGESFRLEGEWSNHPKFGKQFLCSSFEAIVPTGGEALARYLSSGLFKGIGPVVAKRIVETFGPDSLRILDEEPEKLSVIRGLTAKRLASLRASWQAMRGSRETLLFLYSHQITGTTALRLWRHYGADTLRVVQENPYILTDEVWGIGFARADEIARKVGIPKDSWFRLRAGLLFTLQKAAREGHVFLPRHLLLDHAVEVLQVQHDEEIYNRIIYSLDGLLKDGDMIEQSGGMWLPGLHRAEYGIAITLRSALQRQAVASNPAELSEQLAQFQKAHGITYSDEQFQGICQAVASRVFLLTGGPGTGKTTTLRGILHLLDHRKEKVLLAAPTGRAAKRMTELCGREALTLHRLLEINPANRLFERNAENPLDASCVVVDEFSMVDTWLCYALCQALSPHTRLLVIGDQDQLPSVGPGSVLREMLSCPQIPCMRLTKIFRQAGGNDIAENAHRINQGQRPNLHTGTHFHFIPAPAADAARQALLDLVLDTIPRKLTLNPLLDMQVLTPMHKGPAGTMVLNPMLQKALNPEPRAVDLAGTSWRKGDRVMQLKNNYEKSIFNGDIGFVVRGDPDESMLVVDFDGRQVTLATEELDQLTLAYACTVHKSQGSEYSAVVLILDASHYPMLQRNLLYTAVTRAKGHVYVVGTPGALDSAIRNNRMNRRHTKLGESIRSGAEFMKWLEE